MGSNSSPEEFEQKTEGNNVKKDLVLVAAVTLIFLGLCIQFDLYERMTEYTRFFEKYEFDEFFPIILVLAICLTWYSFRRARELARDITERKRAEEERERLIEELQEALDKIKTLKGLLPICSECKKIRDDKGYWNQIEGYIETHSDALFSHGICPGCMDKLYGDEDWYNKEDFDK